MASTDSSNATPVPQMGPAEMSGLARRLTARADSVLLRDQPEQQSDMRSAARLIERHIHVLAEIRRAADVTEDESTEPLRRLVAEVRNIGLDKIEILERDGHIGDGNVIGVKEAIAKAEAALANPTYARHLREMLGGA
jgi:hypothetical protein